jgi:hypothetical protein
MFGTEGPSVLRDEPSGLIFSHAKIRDDNVRVRIFGTIQDIFRPEDIPQRLQNNLTQ